MAGKNRYEFAKELIEKNFKTITGIRLAKEIYLI